ncbi:MAG TPA: efflux RND transporter periplasmic adaptor subunit [Deltaproteobacteria bacterium]|nr:efflux RND transporter periplasmic adaptor subunit [Deltaproteobacteria bacterium]
MTSDPVSIEPEGARDGEGGGAAEAGTRLPVGEARSPLTNLRRGPSLRGPRWRWILPLLALAFGLAVQALLIATRDVPETREPEIPSPLVRVITARPRDVRFRVESRGIVVPRTESDLVAEVRGRVVEVAPALEVGGFFAEGDELLRLDDREYRIARDRARAIVALRESEARLARAEAQRRRQLRQRGAASEADLEQFESRESVAEASLAEARASLARAELDLERTVVRAPFEGRVRKRNVDVGQFVSPGSKLARVFAVDYAEVRLPVQIDELAFLDAAFVGLDRPTEALRRAGTTVAGAPVRLTGRIGGREVVWPARLVRAEAAIDERTRMLHVVARIEDPYLLEPEADGAVADAAVPLPVGLFVSAEIEGRKVEGVFVLPLMALRDGDRVFLRDEEGRLRVRAVSVLRRDHDEVVIDGGLHAGEQVVVSPLRIHSEGMRLRATDVGLP